MAKGNNRPEEKPPDQSWLVTFSDCMTLLLCFFVLLLTFSSFDEVKFEQLAGAFHSMSYDSIDPNTQTPRLSMVKPISQPKDKYGSQINTHEEITNKPTKPPLDLIDMSIAKDRTLFTLPSEKVFWAQGISIRAEAKSNLEVLGKYMATVPCRVVIAESSHGGQGDLCLRRAWQVMRYFSKNAGISPHRFSITGDCLLTNVRYRGQPVLEISLMNVAIDE